VVSGTAVSACGDSSNGTAGQYIATAQGFMVTANTDNATVTFKNSQRVTGNNDNFINRPANDRDVIWINITDDTGKFSQTAIGFYNGATDNFDRLFDAKNPNTGSGFTLYSLLNNDKLCVQGLERTQTIDKIVPVGLENNANRTITFHIDHRIGFDNTDIYIRDLYLNTLHDLNAGDYIVNVNAGNIDDRFEILFNAALNNDEFTIDSNSVLLWQQGNNFTIKSTGEQQISALKIYDVTGQLILEQNQLNINQYQVNLQNVATGNLLLFRIVLDNHNVLVKKAIKR
jgi:hypothetical protein